jgi:16S rRNA processing protein RimM
MSTLLMTDSHEQSFSAPLLEVGRIGKPHGVKGDVFVMFVSDRAERRTPGAQLIARKAHISRELTVETARLQNDRYVIHFDGVDNRNDAELLTNAVLYGEEIEDTDALWVHDMIGSRVVGTDGTDYGVCTGVIDNPAHAILEIDSGGLVPIPFVIECVDGVTTIDPPPGLLDASDADSPNGQNQ